jgi:hypothetical protein
VHDGDRARLPNLRVKPTAVTSCGNIRTFGRRGLPGAVWYFLSRNETAIAAVSGVAAITLAGVAVQLHRLNDRHTRFRVHRENMARFLADAQELLQASSGRRITPQEYSSWVSRAKTYLAEHLDSSYVARFGDFSGMTFFSGSGQERNAIDGHCRRLNEFIREFAE